MGTTHYDDDDKMVYKCARIGINRGCIVAYRQRFFKRNFEENETDCVHVLDVIKYHTGDSNIQKMGEILGGKR